MAGPAGVRRVLVLGVCAAVVCAVVAATPPWPTVPAAAAGAGGATLDAGPAAVAGDPIAPFSPGPDPEVVSDTSAVKPAPLVVPEAGTALVDVATAGTGESLLAGAGDATSVKDPAGQGLAVAAGGLPVVVEEVPQAELEEAAGKAEEPTDPGLDGIPTELNPDAGVEESLTSLSPAVVGVPVGVESLGLATAEGLGGRFVAFRLTEGDPTGKAATPSPSGSASATAGASAAAVPAQSASPADSATPAGSAAPVGSAASGESAAAGSARVVRVTVDVAGFAGAFGAGFAGRLRLVVLPGCALTTPKDETCTTPVVLPTRVDQVGRTVSAVVPVDTLDAATDAAATSDAGAAESAAGAADLAAGSSDPSGSPSASDGASGSASLAGSTLAAPAEGPAAEPAEPAGSAGSPAAVSGVGGLASAGGGGTVLALMSGASSGSGTFTATDLSATGSWAVGEQSGAFTYSYPVSLPAPAGGSAPSVSWGYDSGSVDGVSIASNGQASWAGSGWSLGESYVERLYRPCSTDGHAAWQDLCWDTPYSDSHQDFGAVVLSLNGQTMELVWDPVADEYRAGVENGWRVFHRDNGDNDGEWWLVKTPDGTEYRFGWGVINGTSTHTSSVATVPVIGDDAGEPCYAVSGSWCQQGYRWMLDTVTDARENTTSYVYVQDDNYYSFKGSSSSLKRYIQGIYLDRIDYGQ